MSIHLNKTNITIADDSIQYLPATIEGNGAANVEKYFNQFTVKDEDSGVYKNSFRGHPLNGGKFDVPEHYKGIVFTERNKKPLSSTTARNFDSIHGFKSFTFWNWDETLSKNDALKQAVQWTDIANVVSNLNKSGFFFQSTLRLFIFYSYIPKLILPKNNKTPTKQKSKNTLSFTFIEIKL